ncbi:MAG: aminoacyl-tRNA deacylase [Thermaerobacter sp.]|nr:aminoacyl-tRNA deacylase [Thermaerobacter sp.]
MRTPATDVLNRCKIAYTLRAYDEVEKTANEVVQKLALPPQNVFKTLLVQSGRDFAFAVVPSTRELSLRRLARAWGKTAAEMADPQDIQRVTGYVRGSVSPLGARRTLAVFIDDSALRLEVMAVSAGVRSAELLIAPRDLQSAAQATFCAISRDE